MRIVTFLKAGQQHLGVWLNNQIMDVQAAGRLILSGTPSGESFFRNTSNMLDLLEAPVETWNILNHVIMKIIGAGLDRLGNFDSQEVLISSENVQLMAPLPTPGKVICVAGNYPAPGAFQKPDYPTIFLKPSSTVTGSGMPIWISSLTKNVAYEVELALVIGKRTRHVTAENALQHIVGYILANDVGDRFLEKRTSQWTSGKMFDSFTPMGPWLVTQDEIPFPDELEMSTRVNDVILQRGNTANMFFRTAELVSIISDLTTLRPGDVILTGSPKMMDGQPNPNHRLIPGDQVKVSIDGLGELINQVEKELE